MDFSLTDREMHFRDRVRQFTAAGLWNLFMPPAEDHGEADDGFVFTGGRPTNLEYALFAEKMGRIRWATACRTPAGSPNSVATGAPHDE